MEKLLIVLEELGQILKDECGIEIVIKKVEDEPRSIENTFIENKDANEELSLIPEYNFDCFVEGAGSLMANRAAYEVANAHGYLYKGELIWLITDAFHLILLRLFKKENLWRLF